MAKIKKLIILTILPIILISCGQNRVKETKFPSGKIQYKYFFTKNQIDSVYEYFEHPNKIKSITKILSDSTQNIIMFDKYGRKESEGNTVLKNGRYVRIGCWNEKDHGLLSQVEYLPIGDTVLTNQYVSYDKSGKVDIDNSLFYTIDLPDTVEFGREYFFNVKLNARIGMEDLFISKLKLSDELKWDYSNIDEAEFTYNIQEIKMNHWRVEHTFTNKKGNDTIKGGIYVNSTWTEDSEHKDSIHFVNFEKLVYIKKPIFIK